VSRQPLQRIKPKIIPRTSEPSDPPEQACRYIPFRRLYPINSRAVFLAAASSTACKPGGCRGVSRTRTPSLIWCLPYSSACSAVPAEQTRTTWSARSGRSCRRLAWLGSKGRYSSNQKCQCSSCCCVYPARTQPRQSSRPTPPVVPPNPASAGPQPRHPPAPAPAPASAGPQPPAPASSTENPCPAEEKGSKRPLIFRRASNFRLNSCQVRGIFSLRLERNPGLFNY
jgi:hypothetical protein